MLNKLRICGLVLALSACSSNPYPEVKPITDSELLKQIQSYKGVVCPSCNYDAVRVKSGDIQYLVPDGKSWKKFEYIEAQIGNVLYRIPIKRK